MSVAFAPKGPRATKRLQVTTTSSTIRFENIIPPRLDPKNAPVDGFQSFTKSGTVRLFNAGPAMVFYALGDGGADIVNCIPLAVGQRELLSTGGNTSVSAITDGGIAFLHITPGEGGI